MVPGEDKADLPACPQLQLVGTIDEALWTFLPVQRAFPALESLTWRALGTRPVLVALTIVIAAQLAFPHFPTLQDVFDTRPLRLVEGVAIAPGAAMFILLEAEKTIARKYFAYRGQSATS